MQLLIVWCEYAVYHCPRGIVLGSCRVCLICSMFVQVYIIIHVHMYMYEMAYEKM